MASAPEITYTARMIFPIDAPPLERGTITLCLNRVNAVEPHGTRKPDIDLGNVAILPGFVNAHTHLDLSGARGLCPPTPDFTQWLRQVIAFRRSRTPEQVQADIAAGLAECLRFGTTVIGDIASRGASWDLILRAPCRAVVFHELLALSDDRLQAALDEAAAVVAEESSADTWELRIGSPLDFRRGLSPHAPYSVQSRLFDWVAEHGAPFARVATHLAETQAELELLRSHTGPFAEFLKDLNVWSPSGLIAGPEYVAQILRGAIFVHGNYLDPATPFLPTQTLVVCPRTHAAFGHPHHPFPKMKVRVALGTDSLASNPDLDILAEARFLRRHYPEVPPALILRMLTLNGAWALGFDAVTGSLTPGKSADLVVLPLPNDDRDDPHDLVLGSTLPVERVLFRGEWLHVSAR